MKADFPSETGFAAGAWMLRCDVPAIKAVAKVEAGREGAFLDSGEPVILFERHKFSQHTRGRFDGKRVPMAHAHDPQRHHDWSVLSSPTWGGYGPSRVQHLKLQAAVLLDREAALKSASWGLFQILGENHEAAGFPSLQRFITAMYREVDDHLRAFVMFIRHDGRLVDAIRSHDWTTFARIYNGPRYAEHGYHTRMGEAFRDFA